MHNLVLNIDESRLHSAPSFDASNWNELNQGTLDQRVYSFYGVDRNAGTGTSGSTLSGQGTSESTHGNSYPANPSSSSGKSGSSLPNSGSSSQNKPDSDSNK
jgi:hypothetical protein